MVKVINKSVNRVIWSIKSSKGLKVSNELINKIEVK